MQVVSVLSLKGGVGKTTVTLGLVSAALARDIRCVVIDLDPQANCTATLDPDHDPAVPVGSGRVSIADVLADPRGKVVRRAIQPSTWGESVSLIAGSEHAEVHNHPDPGTKRLGRLRTALTKLPSKTDLVLIDCPPSLGQLTRGALIASDRALLVAEPSLYAVAGVQRALEAVHRERHDHHPGLQPLGVVVNRVRPRSVEHQFRLDELRELFGPLVLSPTLPDRSAVQQAQGAAVPIHRWPSAGAHQIGEMFDQLLDRVRRAPRSRTR